MLSEAVMTYLENRSLDPELADKMGWASAPSREGQVLKIPHVRDGKLVGTKLRRITDGKWSWMPERLGAEFWNVDVLYDRSLAQEPIVITEGQFDALACIQAGFIRSVSVPDGWTEGLVEKSNGESENGKLALVERHLAILNAAPAVVLAGDDDVTGWSLLYAAGNVLDRARLRYLRYPKGCKDSNDILRLHGVEALQKTISEAPHLDPPGGLISGFSDAPPQPPKTLYSLDLPWINERIAFQTREIGVLTGRPGSGKTTFICWLINRLRQVYPDIRIGLAPFEADYEELLNNFSMMDGGRLARDRTPEDLRHLKLDLDQNVKLIGRLKARSIKLETAFGLKWLRDMIHLAVVRDGCKIIIVDPWNELEHMPEPNESLTAYTNFALTRLRQFAEDYDIHLLIATHPRKLNPGEVPTGYHVSDSSAWYNKPGLGLTIHKTKDKVGPFVKIVCWKAREQHKTGRREGTTRAIYDPQTSSYYARAEGVTMEPEKNSED